jgi:ketosteroid isomerase-like protein
MEISEFLNHQENDTANITRVKELYKALNGGNKDAILMILSEKATWNVCPGTPHGGKYCGMNEVFGSFYRTFITEFGPFQAEGEVFIDGGDVVVVLGFYVFKPQEGTQDGRFRFSHTWKIASDNRIEGVWQVCDSYEMRQFLRVG